jgi:hypothetical protein
MSYNVIGRKVGTTETTQLLTRVSHEIALALVEQRSRPRMVKKPKGKDYARFYDWQWLAIVRHRDRIR